MNFLIDTMVRNGIRICEEMEIGGNTFFIQSFDGTGLTTCCVGELRQVFKYGHHCEIFSKAFESAITGCFYRLIQWDV